MAQWGNTDDAANSVLWAVSQLKKPANSVNQTALFGNTTPDAFITGQTTGQFGLDATEIGVSNGSVVAYEVIFTGSGYAANAAVTVGGNATANATSNATGRISAVNIVDAGNSYTTRPTVTVDPPATITFAANSTSVIVGNSTVNGFITLGANSLFLANNDVVNYRVPAANSSIGGLANNGNFFVIVANSTAIQLAATHSGPAINRTSVGTGAQAHTLQGETATAVATISGVSSGAAHTGWVLRTVGEGGRAGRVQYETLVAFGGNFSSDAEDVILKDA
jgi:hypothetical protein